MKLRPYQVATLDQLRKKYASGIKKVLLVSPTGSGKTAMFCEILKSAHQKNRHAIMVVRGRSLVDQASDRLADYHVPHGVLMAGHWNNRPQERIQVCSIDTLHRRKIAPLADLVVIDEAHTAGGDSYRWLFSHYAASLFLPVTATPFLKKGMRHVADDYVQAVSMAELIAQNFLVPLKYYCPASINLSGVKIDSTGDYNQRQLYEAADDVKIYADLTETYKSLNPGKTAIAFGINVEHSKKIAATFNSAGIPAKHIDAGTSLDERKAIIAELERREIKIIASVGTMTTGIDVPSLDSLIIARPTASLNLHLQIIGRVTRTAPGKTIGTIFDHAGNVSRHGLAEFDRAVCLDGYKPAESDVKPVACKKCLAIFCPHENFLNSGLRIISKRYYICPYCGHDNKPDAYVADGVVLSDSDDELKELTEADIDSLGIVNRFNELEILRAKTKSKTGKPYNWRWTFHRLIGEYGQDKISALYPKKTKAMEWRPSTGF